MTPKFLPYYAEPSSSEICVSLNNSKIHYTDLISAFSCSGVVVLGALTVVHRRLHIQALVVVRERKNLLDEKPDDFRPWSLTSVQATAA
jgi:hypothetical protein